MNSLNIEELLILEPLSSGNLKGILGPNIFSSSSRPWSFAVTSGAMGAFGVLI